MSLFHDGLTLGGDRELHCVVPGYDRASLANTPSPFYLGSLTGPMRQVIHRQCEPHDLVLVPGVGFRTVTIMMQIGLFPHYRSRNKVCIPKPPALFSTLSNTFL